MTLNQNDSLTMSVHAHSDFFQGAGWCCWCGNGGGVGSGESGHQWPRIEQNERGVDFFVFNSPNIVLILLTMLH